MNLFKAEYVLCVTNNNKFYPVNRIWTDINDCPGAIIKAEDCITYVNNIMFIDIDKFNARVDEIKGHQKSSNIKSNLIVLNAKTSIFYGSKKDLKIFEKENINLELMSLSIDEYLIKKLLE